MIWFKIKNLEHQISIGQLSEKNTLHYLLATIVYGLIYNLYSVICGYSYFTLAETLLAIITAIIFLPILYKENQKIDNHNFIARFIAIGWVVKMKLLLYTLVFIFFYLNFFDLNSENKSSYFILFAFSLFIQILFYVLSLKSFKRIKISCS
jgi:hypothetical protein